MATVFLSYAGKDEALAARVRAVLESAGLKVVSASSVEPGEPVAARIAESIQRSDAVVPLLTRQSVESSWLITEVAIALARSAESGRPAVVPVIAERGTRVPPLLQGISYVDVSEGRDIEAIVAALTSVLDREHKVKPEDDYRELQLFREAQQAAFLAQQKELEKKAMRLRARIALLVAIATVVLALVVAFVAVTSGSNRGLSFALVGAAGAAIGALLSVSYQLRWMRDSFTRDDTGDDS